MRYMCCVCMCVHNCYLFLIPHLDPDLDSSWSYVSVWAQTYLLHLFQKIPFRKFNLKKVSLALVLDSFTEHNNTSLASYLLAFLQPTWQVDNGQFLIVSWNSLILGQHIKGCVGGVGEKLKKKQEGTDRVAICMMCTCTYKSQHSNTSLGSHALTVRAISGSHCQIRASFGTISPVVVGWFLLRWSCKLMYQI